MAATTKTRLHHYAKHHMCNPSNLGTVAEQPASNSQDLRCLARVSAGNNGIKSAVDPADLLIPGLAHIKRPKEDQRSRRQQFRGDRGELKKKEKKRV